MGKGYILTGKVGSKRTGLALSKYDLGAFANKSDAKKFKEQVIAANKKFGLSTPIKNIRIKRIDVI